MRVAGTLFDYDTLIQLPKNPDGTRNHPLTSRHFRLDQIQPDRETKERVAELILNKESELLARPVCK